MRLSEKMILLALENGQMTVQQLMDRCGIADVTVRHGLSQLHAADAVHILDWIRSKNNQWLGVWTLGPGKDASRPEGIKRASPPPGRRNSAIQAIAAIVASGEFNPFACLIGQMGSGR